MERRPLNHDDVVDDLPAYLLGALDEPERGAVAAHLAVCPLCQDEQLRLEEALGQLAGLVPPVSPPDDLRDRFLSRLDEDPVGDEREDEDHDDRVRLLHPPKRLPVLARFGLAAAAVLVIGLASWVVVLRRDLSSTQSQVATMRARGSAATSFLASSSRSVQLVPDAAPKAYGVLYLGPEGNNEAMLMVQSMPPTPSGMVYQIWFNQPNSRVSGGVFTVGAHGAASVMIHTSLPLETFRSMGITEEPGPNGSPGPTTKKLVGCAWVYKEP